MNRFRQSWLYDKLFNPYAIDEFTAKTGRGKVELKRIRKKATVHSFFKSTAWTAGGPMITFVFIGWAALYWSQRKRVCNENLSIIKH